MTALNNRQAVANHGGITGSINGREVNFRVIWDDGVVGDYSGSVNDKGKARGSTSGGGGSATWNFKNPLACGPL